MNAKVLAYAITEPEYFCVWIEMTTNLSEFGTSWGSGFGVIQNSNVRYWIRFLSKPETFISKN